MVGTTNFYYTVNHFPSTLEGCRGSGLCSRNKIMLMRVWALPASSARKCVYFARKDISPLLGTTLCFPSSGCDHRCPGFFGHDKAKCWDLPVCGHCLTRSDSEEFSRKSFPFSERLSSRLHKLAIVKVNIFGCFLRKLHEFFNEK